MKIFISLQLLIVTAAVIAGCIISPAAPEIPAESIKHFDDILQTDFDVITTADAAGTKHFRAFEGDGWLYDSSYSQAIFVCRAEDSFACSNEAFRQRVTVEKQISGICPEVGETVELTVRGGACRYPKERYFYNEYLPDSMPVSTLLTVLYLEGLNFMKPGHSYLVACQTTKLGPARYYGMPYGETCWLDLAENQDIIVTEPYNEADYAKYADNEFFCTSEETLASLLSYKKRVFERFGI